MMFVKLDLDIKFSKRYQDELLSSP